MINIAICDDDEAILHYLNSEIGKILNEEHKILQYTSGYDLEKYLKEVAQGNIQIIITDIDLKDHLGIDVVKRIQGEYPRIKIIFMTGYVGYVQDIFEVDTLYYLAKPIDKKRLEKALEKTLKSIEDDEKNILNITSRGEVININLSEISYIESRLRTVIIYCDKFQETIYKKLSELEKSLPKNFIRCHQSYIVNMDKIKRLNSSAFLLKDNKEVPISQSKYKSTKEKFLDYLGEIL